MTEAVAVGKGNKIESRFPHIIGIAIPSLGLDPQTSRAMLDFHRSRNIQVQFGHAVKNVCRWCFSDAATAESFKQQFGGDYVGTRDKTRVSPKSSRK
jgi:hypothetical protein